jgi:MFS family permease
MAAMLAMYFFAFFQRSAVPGTVFNELQLEWGLSASSVAALGSVYLCIYGGMQLVVGVLADRFGGARTMLFGGLLLAAGAALGPLAPSPATLYAARALTALGDSFFYLCVVKEVSLLFERRRFPALVGVTLFVGYCGGMAAMLPFERAAHLLGWRDALRGVAALTLATVGIGFLALRRLDRSAPAADRLSLRPLAAILLSRRNWPMFANGAVTFPVYFAIQAGLGKKFIQDFVGLGSGQAAGFTLVMMAVSAGCTLLSGAALRRFAGRRKPLLLLSAGLTLGAPLLMLAGVLCGAGPWLFLTGYILLALSNLGLAVNATVMKELNDPRQVAQAIALHSTVVYFGVAVLLTASGAVLDLFKAGAQRAGEALVYPPAAYATLFAVLAGLALVALVVTGFVRETGHEAEAAAAAPATGA